MNTDTDHYKSGQTATIDIGVLDEVGMPVCDATLQLRVKNSELSLDESIDVTRNTDICETFESSNIIPDYTASYMFPESGVYELTLTANNGAGDKVMTRFINVTQVISPAAITRRQATRLYPFGGAPAAFDVYFDLPFTGTVVEKVPADFEITAISGEGVLADAKEDEDFKTITWSDVTALAGETQTFSYTYDAPDVSPMFYRV